MSLPIPTRYIDIRTGLMSDTAGGTLSGQLVFAQGSVFVLPIGFCDNTTDKGDLVTGTGTATITTTIRSAPGGTLLASSTSYTYAAAIASITLNLNTDEMNAYFTATVPGDLATMRLEIRVSLAGQVFAYFSAPVTILRSIYAGDIVGGWMPAFTTQAELTAILTAATDTGTIIQGTLSGAFVTVQLTAGSQSTGGGYYRPDDYNASTNARVWVQLQ